MWQKNICTLICIVFLVGCMTSPGINPTQPTLPEPTYTPTLVNAIPTITSEPVKSSFVEVSLPYQNKQAFSEHVGFRLLVKTPKEMIAAFDFSKMEVLSEKSNTTSYVNYPIMNSNGTLLAQIILQDGKKLLLVRNFLTDQENLVDLPSEAALPEWLDNAKLSIWGRSSGDCERLLLVYDTSTTAVSYPVHPMPHLQTSQCLRLPFLTSDGLKLIYPWEIFDFTTGTSTDVFPFMRSVPELPPAYLLREDEGNISIVYITGDKLNYRLHTPLAELNMGDVLPEMVQLPGLGTKDAWWQPFTWISGQMQIAIDLIDHDTNLEDLIVSSQQVPTNFFLVDLAAHRIFNYGLDRAVFTEGSLPQRTRAGYSSPDGRYFAWTIYDSESGLSIGSKVLDLSTGFMISIPEMESLGWVVLKAK